MDVVWQIPDLVRHIVSFHSDAHNALLVSRATCREECTGVYREWARSGCVQNHHCLSGLGENSSFCVGSFIVSAPADLVFDVEESLDTVWRRIKKILTAPICHHHVLTLDFTFKQTLIRVLREESGFYEIIIITNGWRRRGRRCLLNDELGQNFIYKMLSTSYGTMTTPCSPDSQSYRTLTLVRNLLVDLSVITDGRVWQLLSVQRH